MSGIIETLVTWAGWSSDTTLPDREDIIRRLEALPDPIKGFHPPTEDGASEPGWLLEEG